MTFRLVVSSKANTASTRPHPTLAGLGILPPFIYNMQYYPNRSAQRKVFTRILDILSHGCSQELTADKSRLDEVNDEAVRLIAEGHSGEQIISEQQASLNAR